MAEMNADRRGGWATGLLLAVWLLVAGWQVEEHQRVVDAARSDLRGRSHEIASTLSAVTRYFQFRGLIGENGLNGMLSELARVRTNALVKSTGLLAVGLLNADGNPLVTAGQTNLLTYEALATNELWSAQYVTFVLPLEAASLTNSAPVVMNFSRDVTNGASRGPRDGPRRDRPDEGPDTFPSNNAVLLNTNVPTLATNGDMMSLSPPGENGNRPQDRPRGSGGRGRPPWLRYMSEADFKAYAAKHELHGLVFVMSTDTYRAISTDDMWLRFVVCFFAGISAIGASLAWRNIGRTADLQIRLVRASEINSHLKELNLAAAGLAHETRNPLNIIRGQAQMLSRLPGAAADVHEKSRTIVDETDKVTAQLTEFINYSRPREVRRTRVALVGACREIVHTLGLDIEEKKLQVTVTGDPLQVEADEQLLRQVLFNLLLNAIQAVPDNGKIELRVQRTGANEAALEVCDDGPGVPPENRGEIFKPYFTTHQKGTGLGLAVVQQIVLAHGWEITCQPNDSGGARFRIAGLKVSA